MNFLVGENSTGKSSVLALLKLMSTPQFWNNDDFNIVDLELGSFSELLTTKPLDGKKEFQLGFHIDDDLEERARFTNTFLATYKNEQGSPRLTSIRLFIDSLNILIELRDSQMKVFIKEVKYLISEPEKFKYWIEDSNFKSIPSTIYGRDRNGINLFYEIRNALRNTLPSSIKISGALRPEFLPFPTWIAPIRSKPKRIYESFKLIFSPEGDHTPLLIKHILSNKFKKNISKEAFAKALQKFGSASGLFDKIEIKNLGKEESSPFHLNIFLNKSPIRITNVGYGVGQVLPVLTEILVSFSGNWFSVQQPEVHLHPKAQAALGAFFFEATKKQKYFLVETHSDFLIDRYRLCLKQNSHSISSQVLFFERTKNGNKVTGISIDKSGQYSENQPNSFRSFFINEELDLLSL